MEKPINIPPILEDLKDIEHHMLHFLENHDEQRIASPDFAGNALKGKPAMVVSATIYYVSNYGVFWSRIWGAWSRRFRFWRSNTHFYFRLWLGAKYGTMGQ